jgi:thymidylate synthase (FAD)
MIFQPQVKLISVTPDAEKTMAYIARVSNPNNQLNPSFAGLLRYCVNHNHWSVFEHAHMTVEVETTRGLAPQILRHRSFTFQEFSQRYASSTQLLDDGIPMFELRYQDITNRQNSIDGVDEETVNYFTDKVENHFKQAVEIYEEMLEKGIAKECARGVLPLAIPTRIYISGTIRSWIHYIELRGSVESGTQKEHREIANLIKEIFCEQFPAVAEAMKFGDTLHA